MTNLDREQNRRVDATVVSGRHDTVPSNSKSYDHGIPEVEVGRASAARPHRPKGRYLKGPIMMWDIGAANRLPGQALVVLLAVHHRRDLTRQREVTLPKALMEELGVSRDAKARALLSLEGAGLIRVTRLTGRSARIRLIDQ